MSSNERLTSNGSNDNKKRKDWEFIIVVIVFQAILLLCYSTSTSTVPGSIPVIPLDEEFGTEPMEFYGMFQDVHAMMFVGFGFLMTFLRKYGFGALGFNFLICAYGIQWGIYLLHYAIPALFHGESDTLRLTAYKLIDGDIATAVVLISFGALLGRTNPAQLLVMCFIELILWAINFEICVGLLGIVDVGGSIVVHTFGAYFGLAVSWIIKPPKEDDDNKSQYHSDFFSMIGTLFLWLYWPSFNGYFARREYYFMDRAFVNTVLGLCGSTTSSFLLSYVLNEGKFDMVHIQNATLAGGVGVGAAADLYIQPGAAICIGISAGIISVFGYQYLSDFMENKLKIFDTCGVHNLHGMPGILGGVVSAIVIAAADGKGWYVSSDDESGYPFSDESFTKQAGNQLLALMITLLFALIGGLLTGLLIKFMTFPNHPFTDVDNFIVPDGDKDYLRGTIRNKKEFKREEIDFE